MKIGFHGPICIETLSYWVFTFGGLTWQDEDILTLVVFKSYEKLLLITLLNKFFKECKLTQLYFFRMCSIPES